MKQYSWILWVGEVVDAVGCPAALESSGLSPRSTGQVGTSYGDIRHCILAVIVCSRAPIAHVSPAVLPAYL
jgi:hypothetical protein